MKLQTIPHIPRLGRILALNDASGSWLRIVDEVHRPGAESDHLHCYQDHPISASLVAAAEGRKAKAQGASAAADPSLAVNHKTIPIRVLSDKASDVVLSRYERWDAASGCPSCVGDGEMALRHGEDGSRKRVPCLGPQLCPLAADGSCTLRMKMPVLIDSDAGAGLQDLGGIFEVRSSNFPTLRSIAGHLAYLEGCGKKLSSLRFALETTVASSPGSERSAYAVMRLKVLGDNNQGVSASDGQNEFWSRISSAWHEEIYSAAECEASPDRRNRAGSRAPTGAAPATATSAAGAARVDVEGRLPVNDEAGFSLTMP